MPLLVERAQNKTEKPGAGQTGVVLNWNKHEEDYMQKWSGEADEQTKGWRHTTGCHKELSRIEGRRKGKGRSEKRIGGQKLTKLLLDRNRSGNTRVPAILSVI